MITPPMRPAGQAAGFKRRKVSIEVYFVLYLSAIVLLLGTTTPSKHEDPDAIIQTLRTFMVDFRVGVEKVALVYTMLPAGLEVLPASEQLRRDSVNVVRAWGSVSDVRFEITGIRDTSSGQMLPVESATIEKQGMMAAVVKWRPDVPMKNRVYSITVAASADPEVPASVPAASRERVAAALRSEGRVHDTVTFTVSVFAVTNPDEIHIVAAQQEKIIDTPSTPAALALAPSPGMIPPAGGSSFLAIAGQREVVAPTGGSWSADIIVIGVEDAQREIRPPKFTPANVTVTGWNANGFTISGPAPASDQIVTVETARIADNTPARAQLRVAAATISDPDIPDALYAGETYPLDFRARGVDDGAIRVRVKERGKLVEEGGAQVSYRPTLPGSVEFEWYVSGQLVRRIDRVVSTLPVPTIAAVKRETEDRAIVETRSYGSIAGRANKVNLRILDGNVGDEPEEIDYRYDAASKMHTQRWRVWRHSPERDFSFTAWAIDQRGSAFAKQQRFVVP